jgi:hypothetical protein
MNIFKISQTAQNPSEVMKVPACIRKICNPDLLRSYWHQHFP